MKNILIHGLPGSGKTTIIKRLCVIFKEFNPVGFITSEIYDGENRVGFEVANLFGDSRTFAHTKLKSKVIVGKYKVDVRAFDDLLDKTFSKEKKTGLYMIDEIGRMECASKKFSKLIIELLDSNKPLVAVIAEKGADLINNIKKRDDVALFEITEQNRDLRIKELTMVIRDLLLD
jgi:nucleoside-triphosphatase